MAHVIRVPRVSSSRTYLSRHVYRAGGGGGGTVAGGGGGGGNLMAPRVSETPLLSLCCMFVLYVCVV
jgi:hypothetical protein